MLSEEMIENSTIFFMNPLHFVDVLSNLFHPNQSLDQMLMFARVGIR